MVSACIRTHDRPDLLRRAIASALAQTCPPDEIVVSDDGATTAAPVVAGFGDPRVRHVRAPGSGPTANLRSALGTARGDVLAVLDDDDCWAPGFLAAALAPLERDPELGVVFTNYTLVAGARRMPRAAVVAPGRHDRFLVTVIDDIPVAPSAAVLRRAVWEQADAEAPFQDVHGATQLWLRAAAAGWPFYFVAEWLMDYRLHAGQLSWQPSLPRGDLALMERLRFDDPDAERARRDRLARARLRIAGRDLRTGRAGAARAGVRAARADLRRPLHPGEWFMLAGLREAVIAATLGHPALLQRVRSLWLWLRAR